MNTISHKEIMNIESLFTTKDETLFLIAGPCVIEHEKITLEVAHFLKELEKELSIPVIFKTSYDKANRSSHTSYRGPGIDEGLRIIKKVKEKYGLPVISDVHCKEEIVKAAQVLDLIQIPAFLCRQTDLIINAANTDLPINIKKGQFLSPWEVRNIINKITSTGNSKILVTERGTSFGYNNLVVDMRSIPVMQKFGYPVVFDATHSVQLPGGAGNSSSGQREFVPYLAKAAVAAGANGIFLEVHPDPDKALCDGPNSLALKETRSLVEVLIDIHHIVKRKK